MSVSRVLLGVVSVILLGIVGQPAEARKFSDMSGRFSVEAELKEIKQDVVLLKKSNGVVVEVPIARLSKEDQEYIAALNELQGTWAIHSMNGKPLGDPSVKLWLSITGCDLAFAGSTGVSSQGIVLNPNGAKTPKEFDITVRTQDKNETSLAIYEVSDKELRLYMPKPGSPRPAGFSPSQGQPVMTFRKTAVDLADDPHHKAMAALKELGAKITVETEWGGGLVVDLHDRRVVLNNEMLEHLKAVDSLVGVRLSDSDADQAVMRLLQLPTVKAVAILSDGLTDTELQRLTQLKELEYLRFSSNKITESGIRKFKQALPDCKLVKDSEE